MNNHSSFFDYIGYQKYKGENQPIKLELNIKEKVLSEDGTIPAGVFASMLDIVVGSTISSEMGNPTTTVNLNMNFFDLTNKGAYTAFASITYKDEKMITGEGVVVDKMKNIVAKGVGTFKVLSSK
ncbi:PaaI family thioesterase [Halobacillus seohaensis]|uniref:PaaI family thioesterase n=2 Tax=Halobacillus seohaensis TaxID=447421 RepID=A0ABW2EMK9_9BACI